MLPCNARVEIALAPWAATWATQKGASLHHKRFSLLLQLRIISQADAVQQLVLDTRDLAISSVEVSGQPLKHQLGERHPVRPTSADGPLDLDTKCKPQ